MLPDQLFALLCDTENPQGIALVCGSPCWKSRRCRPGRRPLPVAEEIQDPGNLGTMIRTADAFAFDGRPADRRHRVPFNDKVSARCHGLLFPYPAARLPIQASPTGWPGPARDTATPQAADLQRTDSRSGQLAWHWPVPAALVIGNEARGLSSEARELCSRLVRIPMPGRAESLNAAAAAAILCYELMLAQELRSEACGSDQHGLLTDKRWNHMQIIIIGCGKVGSALARTWSSQGQDVVIVDSDSRADPEGGRHRLHQDHRRADRPGCPEAGRHRDGRHVCAP